MICLCPITTTEDVRAGYCKHIFHSGCLMEWFKKQQVSSTPFRTALTAGGIILVRRR